MNFFPGLSGTAIKRIDSDLQGLIPVDVPITLDTERSHSVAKKLREYYFNNQPFSEDTKAKYANVCILLIYFLLQLLTVWNVKPFVVSKIEPYVASYLIYLIKICLMCNFFSPTKFQLSCTGYHNLCARMMVILGFG
jgi:hypothetical protein